MPIPDTDALLAHPAFARLPVAAALRAKPLGFVDVGARGGIDPVMAPVAGVTAVLAFDPDPEALAELRSGTAAAGWGRYEVDPNGLAAAPGTATLHLCAVPTNHSLLPPDPAFTRRYDMVKFAKVGETTVPTTTLDAAVFARADDDHGRGEFLKLDTQGTEHAVLLGGDRTLRERTVALVVEVEFCAIYAGQKLFTDVDLLLRARGFSFLGFTTFSQRSRKRLDKARAAGRERWLHADALFVKDPLPGGGAPDLDARGRGILFVVALLHRYFDFALEVAEDLWRDDPNAVAAIRELVAALSHADPRATARRVEDLARALAAAPDRANVLAGKFADSYRLGFDYADVPD
jgi:FkbM family methyltransferase